MTHRRTILKALATSAPLLAFPSISVLASAVISPIPARTPAYCRIRVGDLTITALSDGTIEMPMDQLYRGMSRSDIRAYLDDRFQSVPTPTSVNAFLVDTGDRLVLIDSGSGTLMGPTLGRLVDNIRASGYTPELIDDVILTHIHPDHSGGLIAEGRRSFPSAVVHVNEREKQFWLQADDAAQAHPELGPQIKQARNSL